MASAARPCPEAGNSWSLAGDVVEVGRAIGANRFHFVGGKNFGMGSSRPAARSLRNLGLGCLVAQSINGLFFRNCVNFAFPALECHDVFDAFNEGDIAEVDFDAAAVRNVTSGKQLDAIALPAPLLSLLKAGGIYPLLEKEGLIAATAESPAPWLWRSCG